MEIYQTVLAAALAALLSTTAFAADDEDIFLKGDQKLACEAILCLSAGVASGGLPAECAPSIRKYFSIQHRKPSETLRARLNFLRLCPQVNEEHVQQAKAGADQLQQNRLRECREQCARNEFGYDAEGGSLGCEIRCRNDW